MKVDIEKLKKQLDSIDLISADPGFTKIFNFLIDHGNFGNENPYHNINHLLHSFKESYILGKVENLDPKSLRNLMAAALLHDINHSGGFLTDDHGNIEIAKKGVDELFSSSPLLQSEFDVDEIKSIIDATEYPYVIESLKLTHLQKIMRDVDLSQMFEPNWVHQIIFGLGSELFPSMKHSPRIDRLILAQYNFATSVKYETENCQTLYEPKRLKHIELLEKLINIRGGIK